MTQIDRGLDCLPTQLSIPGEGLGAVGSPVANRGEVGQPEHAPEGITGKLDYLVVLGHNKDQCAELIGRIERTFCTKIVVDYTKGGHFGKHYSVVGRTACGIVVAWNEGREGICEYRASIGGSALSIARNEQLMLFGQFLLQTGARCSRFDWAIDDYNKFLSLDSVMAAINEGHYARFESYKEVRSGARESKDIGRTVYLGSTLSDRLIRIYDKEVESKGKIKSIRYELQARDDLANSYFVSYFSYNDGDLGGYAISASAVASVEFVRRDGSSRLDRSERLDWWATWVDMVGHGVRISRQPRSTGLTEKRQWIEKQVAGTLALIHDCMGKQRYYEWISAVVREAAHKSGAKHRAWIETWRKRRAECNLREIWQYYSGEVVTDWG
jgi:DNA relaxase NicK